MRLTSYTDFGLRTLMRLAGEPGRKFTSEQMAADLQVSRDHLVKIVRDLALAGFVSTLRGAGGGFTLAKPASEISIGSVVRHLERRQALVECFRNDGGCCVLTPKCRLKRRLHEASEAFLTELDKTTLSQCAVQGTSRKDVVEAVSAT